MLFCLEEVTSHHYRAPIGFGPVLNGEEILFAVFETTERDGLTLTQNSFSRNLNNANQSAVRSAFITRRVFKNKIVGKKRLIGVSIAKVKDIRNLRVELNLKDNTKIVVRGICVIDRVEKGDPHGHASMGYTRTMNDANISDNEKRAKRVFTNMELAARFSEIKKMEELTWMPIRILRYTMRFWRATRG